MQQEMKIRLSLITPFVAHIKNVSSMTINSSSGQSESTATHQFLNSAPSDIGIVCSWTGLDLVRTLEKWLQKAPARLDAVEPEHRRFSSCM